MLPKKKRIPRKLFPVKFSDGARHADFFSLRYTPTEEEKTETRFAVVVSKKVAPRAVDRNKLRRRAYALIREYEKSTPLPPGRYVLFAKKGSTVLSFTKLNEEIFTLFGLLTRTT